jgi:hypothetical protein
VALPSTTEFRRANARPHDPAPSHMFRTCPRAVIWVATTRPRSMPSPNASTTGFAPSWAGAPQRDIRHGALEPRLGRLACPFGTHRRASSVRRAAVGSSHRGARFGRDSQTVAVPWNRVVVPPPTHTWAAAWPVPRKMWRLLGRQLADGVISPELGPVARCTAERLMRRAGLVGARRGRRLVTARADATAARPPDLVDRDFDAEAPNRLWVVDFTYRPDLVGHGVHRLRQRRGQKVTTALKRALPLLAAS